MLVLAVEIIAAVVLAITQFLFFTKRIDRKAVFGKNSDIYFFVDFLGMIAYLSLFWTMFLSGAAYGMFLLPMVACIAIMLYATKKNANYEVTPEDKIKEIGYILALCLVPTIIVFILNLLGLNMVAIIANAIFT